MNGKIILDLCGGTGAWSKPYKDAGYDVRLITLPEYDVREYAPPEEVYGILAAPPCTKFSVAKGNRPRDFSTALEIVKACQSIIWRCRLAGGLKFWAMENPRGFLRQFIGIPKFTFEQWEYGDWQIKPTDIWGFLYSELIHMKAHSMPYKRLFSKPVNAGYSADDSTGKAEEGGRSRSATSLGDDAAWRKTRV